MFNQGELGEGSVRPPGTALNGTAVKLLRALHVLSDRGIDNTILRVTMTEKDKKKRTKKSDISVLDAKTIPLTYNEYKDYYKCYYLKNLCCTSNIQNVLF